VNSGPEKIPFHPFFSVKDLLGILTIIYLLTIITLINPLILGDVENFIPANPLVTPIHIQPE
jgi:ubiquinol-cytochrome c reductase cytochrome b subunit